MTRALVSSALSAELVQKWLQKLKHAPRPTNDKELEILTQWYFGKQLHADFRIYGDSGQYQIKETYNSYHGNGYEFSECCIHGYDHSWHFWRHVFGTLTCGGIAAYSYGQFKIQGHRNKARLDAWQKSRRTEGDSFVRPAFVRLAHGVGVGENRTIRDGSVLIAGREDGAARASILEGRQ